jgi:pimeloyl-ACP methyl ester carboxylesterase
MRPGAAPTMPWHDRHARDDYGVTASPDWRDTDWAKELKTVEVDGVPMNYIDVGTDTGAEEPAVLVHGLGGQWQNWLENIPRLAVDRRVVAMDLPGFGLTPQPVDDEGISIPRYGRFVNGLCDALGLETVELVGNSMGGYIAAEVALQFPERVNRLVLV